MKTVISATVITLAFCGHVRAQTDGVERLVVTVQGASVSAPGGEQPRVSGGANPSEPGKTAYHGFSVLPGRCVWSVSRVVEPTADIGWAVEITPIRASDEEATFRLKWARTRGGGRASTLPARDIELTLRPGESVPLDFVDHSCPSQPQTIGASLRVTVLRYPDPDYDRRLIALDLWLVERLVDGTERSQPLSLRGLYHRPIPFFFDSLVEGAVALDIFGEVTAASGEGLTDLKIMTRSRIFDPSQPPGRPFPRETTATIKITPNEVVSVELPQVSGASAFAGRALSLRVRVRPLR